LSRESTLTMSTVATDPADTTEDCRFCWMCRQACPVGFVTKRETLTPHAWALLIASVRRGALAWNAETADVLYQCADCGLCRTHCVTDRPLPDAIAIARAQVAAAGQAPQAAYALRDSLDARARQASATARPASGSETVLFIGDALAEHRASVEAATTLLAQVGVRATPIGEGCGNGVLASALGFPDTARAQAEAVVGAVSGAGARQVLVLGAGDRYAFERLYRDRLGVTWPEGVQVREVTAVLAEAVAQGGLRLSAKPAAGAYAYHDPCHSTRVGRDHEAPRALLAAALGESGARRLFWREQRAHPCGSVGALAHTHPDLANQLSDARLADAAQAGATVLVTEEPSCLRHLQSRSATDVSVVGLYELLLERLQG
jgi:Fe-S oxidoreductase